MLFLGMNSIPKVSKDDGGPQPMGISLVANRTRANASTKASGKAVATLQAKALVAGTKERAMAAR